MTDALAIPVVGGPIHGRIRPPGSKSLTNRALVCAGLARGTSTLSGCLDSQDTRVMAAGLQALGVRLQADWDRGEIRIEGTDGRIPAREATIECAASGTTMRFLAAVCALGDGTYRLDGTARMRRRPIGDLVDALRGLGVDAVAESAGGCPPVLIRGHGLRGGEARVKGDTSSQFASGLALAAPCMPLGLRLTLEGTLVSLPYLEMTRRLMTSFGATCTTGPGASWTIAAGGYAARDQRIEPDASAASYFFAAAALTGGSVRVDGLSRRSVQGDVAFCDALERMGCTVAWEDGDPAVGAGAITVSGRAVRGIDIDMNAISDTVPTLAVVALFAGTPTTIRNVAHIRDKETDRIGDLVRELRRLGADASEHADGLTIVPAPLHGGSVATYDDHRMAMSLGLVGLLVPGVRIEDPACVGKTFPDYWRRLADVAGFAPGWPPA
ncbi:MAG: 3-phosphoshikimate 1-carboxyvinyltransferase [Planctomycetota bacterium]|nr:MAG: 3-phosphoshikimate 1-carboxyvinyltransferase [Planctomycetota bacterium]